MFRVKRGSTYLWYKKKKLFRKQQVRGSSPIVGSTARGLLVNRGGLFFFPPPRIGGVVFLFLSVMRHEIAIWFICKGGREKYPPSCAVMRRHGASGTVMRRHEIDLYSIIYI